MTEQIYAVEPDGTLLRRVVTSLGVGESSPTFSPDGSKLAFERFSACTARPACAQIWIQDDDGRGARPVTPPHLLSKSPAWSPNGETIAFVRVFGLDDEANSEIYAMSAQGGGERRLTNTATGESDLSWSPDGEKLAFTCGGRDAGRAICVMDADGKNRRGLTGDGWNPDWSPNGKQILFTRGAPGIEHVHVIDAEGGAARDLTGGSGGDYDAAWSPDGKQIVFISQRDFDAESPSLYVMNADGSDQRRVRYANGPRLISEAGPDWAPRRG